MDGDPTSSKPDDGLMGHSYTDDGRDLQPTADLLNLVFSFQPPIGSDHLDWYYRDNPHGRASVGRAYENGQLVGNYALVPLLFQSNLGPNLRLGLGVDLSTRPDSRGTGSFRRTVEDSYRVGTTDGLDGILGVANAQSIPRMVQTLGWRRLPDSPARLIVPLSHSIPTNSYPVDASLLAGTLPDQALPRPTSPPPTGLGTLWTAELLRWRLARPGAQYVLHLRDDVSFVSTTTFHRRVRVAVLLKVLPRLDGVESIALRGLAATLARYHRTPLVLHWGVNPLVHGGGLSLPRRLMPSPLGLVLHALDDDGVPRMDVDSVDVTSFEFLDFDAY